MLASALGALALAAAAPAAAQPASSPPSSQDGWNWEVAVPVAAIGGHTKYRIADADAYSSIASELEFPLGGVLAGVQARLANRRDPGGRRVVFRLAGLTSLGTGSGTMKDSDWLSGQIEYQMYGTYHDGKDIYSESHADLSARVLEARVEWELDSGRNLILAPMAGVFYQRFEYDVRDANQYGYGPYTNDYTGYVPGKVLEYDVSYLAPYIGVRAALARGRLSATADLWFSPAASAEDRDDHLARAKLSTTDASGSAWQASFGGRLAFGERSGLEAQVSLVRFEASGTQHQSFYAGPYAGQSGTIPSTITSSRTTFLFVFVHRLGE